MPISPADDGLDAKAASVSVTDEMITVRLVDGRTIAVPTEWYPRLRHANVEERRIYEITDVGVIWPDIEADFSIRGLLLGRRSGENPAIFRFWLANRKRGRRVTFIDWMSQRRKRTATNRAKKSGGAGKRQHPAGRIGK